MVKIRVGIDYSSVPQSCSFCRAFGHYDSRCEKNPSYVKPPAKEKAPQKNKGKEKEKDVAGGPVEKDQVATPVNPVPTSVVTPAATVGTSNKFAVLEDGEIDTSIATEVIETNSEQLFVNCTDGKAVPHDAPVSYTHLTLPTIYSV